MRERERERERGRGMVYSCFSKALTTVMGIYMGMALSMSLIYLMAVKPWAPTSGLQ